MATNSSPPPHHRAYPRDFTNTQVIAYLGRPAPDDLAPLIDAVHAYAASHHLGTVEAVYREPHDGTGTLRTPFERCLHDLQSGKAHAVIVPAREDLPADPAERASLRAWVRAAGGTVHVMNEQARSWR